MGGNKDMPVGVKIISILYYIGAVLGVLFGVLFLIGTSFLGSLGGIMVLFGGLFVVAGIILIILGVLGFFIGKGLWQGKNWARITAIVLSVLGFLGALPNFDIISLIINAVIGGYLWFSKDVKRSFA